MGIKVVKNANQLDSILLRVLKSPRRCSCTAPWMSCLPASCGVFWPGNILQACQPFIKSVRSEHDSGSKPWSAGADSSGGPSTAASLKDSFQQRCIWQFWEREFHNALQLNTPQRPPALEPQLAFEDVNYSSSVSEGGGGGGGYSMLDMKGFCEERADKLNAQHSPFTCKICNQSFPSSLTLQAHARSHGYRPHICMVCSRSFTQFSNLQRHERIHTGCRPYSCKVCNKSFCDSSNLLRHERIHTGHRPYVCKTCNKSFSILSNMRRHERIHTSLRLQV